MAKFMVSSRFSLEPIHWHSHPWFQFLVTSPKEPYTNNSNYSYIATILLGIITSIFPKAYRPTPSDSPRERSTVSTVPGSARPGRKIRVWCFLALPLREAGCKSSIEKPKIWETWHIYCVYLCIAYILLDFKIGLYTTNDRYELVKPSKQSLIWTNLVGSVWKSNIFKSACWWSSSLLLHCHLYGICKPFSNRPSHHLSYEQNGSLAMK